MADSGSHTMYFLGFILLAIIIYALYKTSVNNAMFITKTNEIMKINNMKPEMSVLDWILGKSINNNEDYILFSKGTGGSIEREIHFTSNDIVYSAIDIDGATESSGSLPSAALGGAVFGPFGAVVGAIAGKEIKNKVISMIIYVGFTNGEMITITAKESGGLFSSIQTEMRNLYHFFAAKAESNKIISSMQNTSIEKVCPYCAETIKAAAIVCKHCGRDLPQTKT
jgi:hypothetical protein